MEKTYRGFQTAGWLLCIFLAATYFASGIIFSRAFESVVSSMAGMSYVIAELIQVLPVIICCIVAHMQMPAVPYREMLGIRSFDKRLIILMIILAPMMQTFAAFITLPIDTLITSIFGAYSSDLPVMQSADEVLVTIFALCVLTPIVEEIFFRGVINALLEPYGLTVYVFGSAAMFALMHMDITSFCTIFVLGAVMALIRAGTKSIFPSMIFHSVNNLISVIYAVLINTMSNSAFTIFSWVAGIGELVLCPIILAATYKVITDRQTAREVFDMPVKQRTGVSVGFAVLIGVYAAYHIVTELSVIIS